MLSEPWVVRDAAMVELHRLAAVVAPTAMSVLPSRARRRTDAVRSTPGLLESADGGTVFLDEVGEVPPPVQAKLLRVVEDGEVRPVGGRTSRRVDVRFVAATNRDLRQAIAAGSFRADLYFRLSGSRLAIPPLRARPSELEPLARLFLARAAAAAGRAQAPRLTVGALDRLLRLDPVELRQVAGGRPRAGDREAIGRALETCAGNQTRAARLLGISRATFIRRLEAHDFPRPRASSPITSTTGVDPCRTPTETKAPRCSPPKR